MWGWPTPVITDSGLRHSGGAENATGWKIEENVVFLACYPIARSFTSWAQDEGRKARGGAVISALSHIWHLAVSWH